MHAKLTIASYHPHPASRAISTIKTQQTEPAPCATRPVTGARGPQAASVLRAAQNITGTM